jgi:hypothetical protein
MAGTGPILIMVNSSYHNALHQIDGPGQIPRTFRGHTAYPGRVRTAFPTPPLCPRPRRQTVAAPGTLD